MRYPRCAVTVLVCILGLAAPAAATPITILIGVFSFDELIPTDYGTNSVGVNRLAVWNVTDLLLSPLTFPSLTVTHTIGSTVTPLNITDPLGAGAVLELPALEFAATTEVASAQVDGLLDVGTFVLPDGRLFTADSLAFSVLLLPVSGSSFLLPADFAEIQLSGEVTTVVPEPPTLLPVIAGIAVLGIGLSVARRRSPHARSH